MKAIQSATPEGELLEALLNYQNEVNQELDYPKRVMKANELWDTRSYNPVFVRLRDLLLKMCTESQCMYCESSVANQLEHFQPKAFYPEHVFSWANYLLICNPCNRIKWNRYAVFSFSSGGRVDLNRRRGEPVREPERGTPLLINPREENPLDFLQIDLQGTGRFLPRVPAGTRDWIRAEYTATELLDLNNGIHRQARRNAYDTFKIVLREYVRARDGGEATDRCVEVIRQARHPGVWAAMKRDWEIIPELRPLFESAPEALNW
jgi:hypothetical protein